MLRRSLFVQRFVALVALAGMMTACGASGGDDDEVSSVVSPVAEETSTVAPITIMPIGDSHTQGATGWGTYRCYLDAMLKGAEVPFDFVGTQTEPYGGEPYGCPSDFDQDHEAFWGTHIQRLADIATPSVETLQPDVALILIGGVDLDRNQPARVAEDLQTFIIGLQAVSPDITVFVSQLIPCNMPLPKCTDPYVAVNDLIASFGTLSTDESSVAVVDMATGLGPDYYQDAVHMNSAGDELVADRWMTALQDSGVIGSSD